MEGVENLYEIDPRRHRELAGRDLEPWARRAGIVVLVAFIVLALLDVFGQRPESSIATGPAASLEVHAPTSLRGGLLYQSRFEISALRELRQPKLVLGRGWLEGLTINTIEPQAMQEGSDNGRLLLEYETVPAGRSLIVWVQYQVNPTSVGKQAQPIELYDGGTRLLRLDHSLRIFP